MTYYDKLCFLKKEKKKQIAILIDPDKFIEDNIRELISYFDKTSIFCFFVGGSLVSKNNIDAIVIFLKKYSSIPVILFPGSFSHISAHADGILFLSLISGRNPEHLIGQHVLAAPLLKSTALEIIPTGYMIIDCGSPTTVSYISNTEPIPYNKPEIASCTALAGEYLGLKLIYLDGGSGADKPVSNEMIRAVSQKISLPVVIGGGIRSGEDADRVFSSGADLIVVGNALESNPAVLQDIIIASKTYSNIS